MSLKGKENASTHNWEIKMKRELAIVKVELIDENITERNEKIVQELLNWFQDVFSSPWVKDVKDIAVKDW